MKNKPPITAAERQQARLQDADKGRVERFGITAAQRVGARAQRAAYRAFRRGDNPASAFGAVLHEDGIVVLTQTMVLAHVLGVRRSQLIVQAEAPIAARRGGLLSQNFRLALRAAEQRAKLTDEEIEALAERYTPYASKVIATAEAEVNRGLASAMVEATAAGEHVHGGKMILEEEIKRQAGTANLKEAFERLGLSPQNSFTFEAIFRTQTAIAYSSGRYQTEQDPAIQEILWGYRYVTVGDTRVRDEHVGFDGVTLPKDDPFWLANTPPNGWCCRCAAISVFEERPVFEPRAVDIDGDMVEPKAGPGFAVNFGALAAAV